MIDNNHIFHYGFPTEKHEKEIREKEKKENIKMLKVASIFLAVIIAIVIIVSQIQLATFNNYESTAISKNDSYERSLTTRFAAEAEDMGYDVSNEGFVKGNKYYFLSKSKTIFQSLNSLKISEDEDGKLHIIENSKIF